MRLDFLTPHQFGKYATYIDTLLVTTHTVEPLDVAIPSSAARFIGMDTARRIHESYFGRMALLELGAITAPFESVSYVEMLAGVLPTVDRKYGVLLCDRVLETPFQFVDADNQSWLFIDWWKWFSERVEKKRLADAFMYACHASEEYYMSPERRELGIDINIAKQMAQEGRRLMQTLAEECVQKVRELWGQSALTTDLAPSE